jgi:hypothetical protein
MKPSIYAVYFPRLDIFKIGFTSKPPATHICAARTKGRRSFGDDGGTVESIWIRPGDFRYEVYIQAKLSFRFTQPDTRLKTGRGGSINEWFDACGLTPEEFAASCEYLYQDALAQDCFRKPRE